jgi:hypothetical protein
MPTDKERIEVKAIEILRNTPDGVRYSDLKNKIKENLPDVNINHIRGTIWNLYATKPNDVYKAGRGLFRHVIFRESQVTSQEKIELHPAPRRR